ncbi:phage N-6-adenine-methyltransferase [Cronobacter malonaticus]|uniref:phage N-6-adenine-methyltransferase n=1 Tax=Cronobacter malonaticus TaxID=413503 RepID=UPI0024C3C1E6|nr:phage N-6-adenine-methyltransferase [Cronobacter malonaticus]MDK1177507.1 phage N-6-adenine-methyltransferase [Cronobacter malonaticus]MDK1687984.1 phage N-6-adenine-methyltransferase [Cronobacter malonaticus]
MHALNTYNQALAALRSKPAHELKEVGDQWRTPDNIFWGINAMFGPLVLDLFSDGENAKCEAYYTAEDNALTQDWSARLAELNGAAFGNPRNAFYWRFVELGTSNMPAHPFVRPAFDTRQEEATQAALARMNQAIDEVLAK